MHSYIRRTNLIIALELAIIQIKEHEKAHGFTGESAQLAGLRDNLACLQGGGTLSIIDNEVKELQREQEMEDCLRYFTGGGPRPACLGPLTEK